MIPVLRSSIAGAGTNNSFSFTLTAGTRASPADQDGYRTVSDSPDDFGSLSDDSWFDGDTIERLYTDDGSAPTTYYWRLKVSPISQPDTDAEWSRIEITGSWAGGTNPRTITYTRSSRDTYAASSGGGTIWVFNTGVTADDMFVNGNNYTVTVYRN